MLYKNLIIRTFSSDHPHNNCILWKCADNKKLRIITKERTEGGLNKGAYLLPLYSNHFWFFRIEQSRVLYGDSITPFTIIRLSHSFFQQGGLIGFSSFQGRLPLSPDKTRLIPLYTTMIRRYCYIDILAEDRVHSTWYHHTLDI